MNNYSKLTKGAYIINGNNHKVDTTEKLREYVKKGYNAECGSGFYCIEDLDIAKKYAYTAVHRYGGQPTLNFYLIDHKKIKEDLEIAYFNCIEDPRTLEYLGANLSGQFPSFCKVDWEQRQNKVPADLCNYCGKNCLWAADYVEAILSEATYNLDKTFVEYWNRQIPFEDALNEIYRLIDEQDDRLRIQVVLRGKILDIDDFDYLKYVDSIVLEETNE